MEISQLGTNMIQETIMELTGNIKHKIWQWSWENHYLLSIPMCHWILISTLWVRNHYSQFLNNKTETHRGCEPRPRLHVSYVEEIVLTAALFSAIEHWLRPALYLQCSHIPILLKGPGAESENLGGQWVQVRLSSSYVKGKPLALLFVYPYFWEKVKSIFSSEYSLRCFWIA